MHYLDISTNDVDEVFAWSGESDSQYFQLSAGDLVSVLDQCHAEAVVVCCHGDLAGALPESAKLKSTAHDKGWFKVRPVLAIVRYKQGGNWDQAQVLCCESPANNWQSLFD